MERDRDRQGERETFITFSSPDQLSEKNEIKKTNKKVGDLRRRSEQLIQLSHPQTNFLKKKKSATNSACQRLLSLSLSLSLSFSVYIERESMTQQPGHVSAYHKHIRDTCSFKKKKRQ